MLSDEQGVLFPCLKTANSAALTTFELAILAQVERIERWFAEQWQRTPAPLTTSIDLRHAGFKLAPIDTNLFPAGFNNLDSSLLPLCAAALKTALNAMQPGCQRVLILPESHTRNSFYLSSVSILRHCLLQAGFEVRIGSLDESILQAVELRTNAGDVVRVEPLLRKGNRVSVQDFDPCVLLLNHDLSTGIPNALKRLEQPIYPTSRLGWSQRLKSSHFDFYNAVSQEFALETGIDSWLLNPISQGIDGIDFMQKTGLTQLAEVVDSVLQQVKIRYHDYGIDNQPFVVVKADNGTYGMSVMSVHEGAELLTLNRKQRTRMSASKGSQKVTRVLVQEGVYSIERMKNQAVAEPVVYALGPFVVGGFYRVHDAREHHESLNTPGMYFNSLTLDSPGFQAYTTSRSADVSNRFYVYGVVARLAALAAAREIANSEVGG